MRITSSMQGQAINISNLADILSKLNVGDVVRAQVIDITANELLLKLFDGTTFKATSMADVDAKQGEFVNFMVKDKNEDQLILETLKNKIGNPLLTELDELKKQLTSIGLKPDEKNVDIAKELKNNNLPINKEAFDKITISLEKFKDLTPAKAAFLISSSLNLEEKNISSLNQLVDNRFKIGGKLEELFNELSNIKDRALTDKIEKGLTALDKFVNVSSDKEGILPEKVNVSRFTKLSDNNSVNNVINNNTDNTNNSTTAQTPEKAANWVKNDVLDILKSNINQLKDINLKNTLENINLPEKIMNFIETNKLNQSTEGKLRNDLANLIRSNMESASKMPLEGQKFIDNTVNELIQKMSTLNIKADPEFIEKSVEQNDKFKNVLRKTFESLFVRVDSDTLKEDLNVKNTYKDAYHRLEVIKEAVQNSNIQNKNEVLSKVEDIQNNLKFINDINNYNTYVQMPINLLNKNTTGELYILKKDGKRKKIDPENATLFISLDTLNIGQIDTLISINKKSISLNMRAESQEIINFIKENSDELYGNLSEIGYKLVDMKYRIIDEQANVVNIKEVAQKDLKSGKQSIDYRI